MAKPALNSIQSFQLHAGDFVSSNYLTQIIAASNAQAVIVAVPDTEPEINRSVADPQGSKLIFGFMPVTYTSPGNTPELFTTGILQPDIAGAVDPNIPAQTSVKYWTDAWKKVLFSAIDNCIAHGYDGIFLDSLSSDTYWSAGNSLGNPFVPNAAQLLAETLQSLREYVNLKNLSHPFYLIGNSPISIAYQYPSSLNTLDAIFNENLLATLDGTAGNGTQYTTSISPTTIDWFFSHLLPQWEKSTATIIGNDYFLSASPQTLIDSFLKYNDLGIVFSETFTDDYGKAFLNGPNFFTANNSQPIVYGAKQEINYIAGGHTLNATLIGGESGDTIVGGDGKNTILAGAGDDIIYAHPTKFLDRNILDIDVKSVIQNEPYPSISIQVNGIAVGVPVEVTATWNNNQVQHVRFDLSTIGPINSIILRGSNLVWADNLHYNALQPMGISFNGTNFSFSSGTISGSAVVNQDGGTGSASIGVGGSLTFGSNVLPINTVNTVTNDFIDGGSGNNSVIYDRPKSSYQIVFSKNNNNFSLTGPDGVDTLQNIQVLKFSDQSLDATSFVKTASLEHIKIAALVQLYIASFDRAPDSVGLDYWGSRLSDGMSLQDIAKSFFVQKETIAAYPVGLSTSDFVTKVYNNVLSRGPDTGGLNYWVGQLNNGSVSKDAFLLAIINGAMAASGSAVDRQTLANKEAVGEHYAIYQGLNNSTTWAQDVMSGVTNVASTVTAANAKADNYAVVAANPATSDLVVKLVGVAV